MPLAAATESTIEFDAIASALVGDVLLLPGLLLLLCLGALLLFLGRVYLLLLVFRVRRRWR